MSAANVYSLHFTHLPISQRMVYTMTLLTLGVGYLFAMLQVVETYTGLDGKSVLTVDDLRIAYSGKHGATRLQTALMGPMQGMLPAEERQIILGWAANNPTKKGWEQKVKPIMDNRCLVCHNGSDPHRPNYTTWEGVSKVVSLDRGMSIATLVRVSHIHLFGLTFIFFIVSSIFVHAYIRPLWVKYVLIVLPFLGIISDIASWYLTKYWPGFAWAAMIVGVVMGISFAIQWAISIYQMWFYKLPSTVETPGSGPSTIQ